MSHTNFMQEKIYVNLGSYMTDINQNITMLTFRTDTQYYTSPNTVCTIIDVTSRHMDKPSHNVLHTLHAKNSFNCMADNSLQAC
jgi:hypothetical protein